jgi:hypothetical protein
VHEDRAAAKQVVHRDALVGRGAVQRIEHAARRIGRHARHFRDVNAGRAGQNEVGERAADIDADAPALRAVAVHAHQAALPLRSAVMPIAATIARAARVVAGTTRRNQSLFMR